MTQLYTPLDAQILQAVSEIGPRNLAKVAREVGIPQETLRYRLKRLSSRQDTFLRMHGTTYHTKLGLKKAVVVLRAKLGYEDVLFKCLKLNGYWIYISRFYGNREGCLATYTIPEEHSSEFKTFIQKIVELGIAEDQEIHWSTCFQPGTLTTSWFDEETGEWTFNWNEWVKQVQSEATDLPYTLVDPSEFKNHADYIDIFILKELEKDATRSLKDIATMLGISLQKAFYHYRKHLIEKKLLEDYEIFIYPHEAKRCGMYYFFFAFPNYETMAKFANSLLDKHFVRYVGKILNESKLLAELLLPIEGFREFIEKLSLLSRKGLLKYYDYVIMDLKTGQRQTFSYEFFKDGVWLYNQKKQMADVHRLARALLPSKIQR